MPLGRFAMHVATLPMLGKTILNTPGMDMADPNQKFPSNVWSSRGDATLANLRHRRPRGPRCPVASPPPTHSFAEPWKLAFGEHATAECAALHVVKLRSFFFNHSCSP